MAPRHEGSDICIICVATCLTDLLIEKLRHCSERAHAIAVSAPSAFLPHCDVPVAVFVADAARAPVMVMSILLP